MAKDPVPTTQQTTDAPLPDLFRSPRSLGRSRRSILIVDDDAELASRYQRALEAYGYLVDHSALAELGQRLANKTYDVVVGDVAIDAGSAEALRALPCPLVLLSHGLAFASALAAVRCGAYRYLLKPVSAERLLEVLVETMRECSRPAS